MVISMPSTPRGVWPRGASIIGTPDPVPDSLVGARGFPDPAGGLDYGGWNNEAYWPDYSYSTRHFMLAVHLQEIEELDEKTLLWCPPDPSSPAMEALGRRMQRLPLRTNKLVK